MKRTYKHLPFVVLSLLLCLQGWAREHTEPIHKARFRGLAWDSDITDLNIYHGTKVVPMTLYPNGRSGFYNYLGPDPMLFFREVTGSDGKMVPEVSGSIPLSEFKERTLLLFFSNPGAPGQYQVVPVDDSDKALPAGGYCFMNLSKLPLQLKCGAAEGKLDAGGTLTLQGNPADQSGITGIQIDAISPNGAINHVYSNMIPFGKTNRTLVFVYQAPGTGAFVVKRIAEDAAMIPRSSPAAKR